jgi:hypothetical protein
MSSLQVHIKIISQLWLQVEGKKRMLNSFTYYVDNPIVNVI